MPVYKYRSIEDMPETWQLHGDAHISERLRVVLSMAKLAGPLELPRGVRKYRSVAELVAEREERESARIERIRQRVRKP